MPTVPKIELDLFCATVDQFALEQILAIFEVYLPKDLALPRILAADVHQSYSAKQYAALALQRAWVFLE